MDNEPIKTDFDLKKTQEKAKKDFQNLMAVITAQDERE